MPVKSMIAVTYFAAAARVPPDVLVDAADLDAVEPVRIVDQGSLALRQDSVVGGVPRDAESFGDSGDGEVLAHDPFQRPPMSSARPAATPIEVVAMDGFTGFKTATAEELPDAVAVMDPFHVVRLVGDTLDRCRRRVQPAIHGHRGHKNDLLYSARRTPHTGAGRLTDKQIDRLVALFAADEYVEAQATWGIYQRMIGVYREPRRAKGKRLMQQLIESVSNGVPAPVVEIVTLGRTLTKRAADVLAYFDRLGTSNGPTEAINGRLEHLRGSALGFRNVTNYIARSLLETGGFRPQLQPQL